MENSLEFTSIPDLLDELQRRVNYGAIVLAIDRDATCEKHYIRSWGGVAAIGAADYALQEARLRFGPSIEAPEDSF